MEKGHFCINGKEIVILPLLEPFLIFEGDLTQSFPSKHLENHPIFHTISEHSYGKSFSFSKDLTLREAIKKTHPRDKEHCIFAEKMITELKINALQRILLIEMEIFNHNVTTLQLDFLPDFDSSSRCAQEIFVDSFTENLILQFRADHPTLPSLNSHDGEQFITIWQKRLSQELVLIPKHERNCTLKNKNSVNKGTLLLGSIYEQRKIIFEKGITKFKELFSDHLSFARTIEGKLIYLESFRDFKKLLSEIADSTFQDIDNEKIRMLYEYFKKFIHSDKVSNLLADQQSRQIERVSINPEEFIDLDQCVLINDGGYSWKILGSLYLKKFTISGFKGATSPENFLQNLSEKYSEIHQTGCALDKEALVLLTNENHVFTAYPGRLLPFWNTKSFPIQLEIICKRLGVRLLSLPIHEKKQKLIIKNLSVSEELQKQLINEIADEGLSAQEFFDKIKTKLSDDQQEVLKHQFNYFIESLALEEIFLEKILKGLKISLSPHDLAILQTILKERVSSHVISPYEFAIHIQKVLPQFYSSSVSVDSIENHIRSAHLFPLPAVIGDLNYYEQYAEDFSHRTLRIQYAYTSQTLEFYEQNDFEFHQISEDKKIDYLVSLGILYTS